MSRTPGRTVAIDAASYRFATLRDRDALVRVNDQVVGLAGLTCGDYQRARVSASLSSTHSPLSDAPSGTIAGNTLATTWCNVYTAHGERRGRQQPHGPGRR